MSNCELCKEKDKTIRRILTAYKRDKKLGLIVIGVLAVELIFSLAYGKEGIIIAIDKISGLLK